MLLSVFIEFESILQTKKMILDESLPTDNWLNILYFMPLNKYDEYFTSFLGLLIFYLQYMNTIL